MAIRATWEERSPREGETVRITWARWYAALVKQQTAVGVFLKYSGGRLIIDLGDRNVWLIDSTGIEVLNP